MSEITDQWETPQWLFDELNDEFNFKIDLCASEENKKCHDFYDDVFKYSSIWTEGSIFMNPPYSKPAPFIQKAWDTAFKDRNIVVMLLKCDTSTSWWGIFWDYENHKPKANVEIRFMPKRLQFFRPDKKKDNANFPSCIVILRGRK